VYDITKGSTFDNLDKWFQDIKDYAEQNVVIMIVGNKNDLKHLREVKPEDARAYAEKKNVAYIETSALDANNVDVAFQRVIGEIYQLFLNSRVHGTGAKSPIPEGDYVHIDHNREKDKKTNANNGGCC